MSVWTVSIWNLRIQNIFGAFHVRSQSSSSVEEVFDDLLVSHTTRTEPVLPIRLSSRQPIRNKKERRPVLRRERAERRRQTSQTPSPRMLKVVVPVSEISSVRIFRPKRICLEQSDKCKNTKNPAQLACRTPRPAIPAASRSSVKS